MLTSNESQGFRVEPQQGLMRYASILPAQTQTPHQPHTRNYCFAYGACPPAAPQIAWHFAAPWNDVAQFQMEDAHALSPARGGGWEWVGEREGEDMYQVKHLALMIRHLDPIVVQLFSR